MIYEFEQFELDLARFELRENGEPCSLEPQVLALLALLIEHRDRLLSKEEIFEKLWDGRVVTDATLLSRIKSARKALGDSGKTQRFIKTVYGKGFRFVADVRALNEPAVALPLENAKPGTGGDPLPESAVCHCPRLILSIQGSQHRCARGRPSTGYSLLSLRRGRDQETTTRCHCRTCRYPHRRIDLGRAVQRPY